MRVLVLGGYGAVGARVMTELAAREVTAIAAGRDRLRADRVVDLTVPGSLGPAVSDVDVVVNAAGSEDPALAKAATDRGVAFVELTASTGYVARLERMTPAAPLLLSVGLAPGLTNLLAADLHTTEPGPIDLAVLLGAGERHGAAATEWTYGLLGRRFVDPAGGLVRNYSRPAGFELPGLGKRRLYRTDFADQHVLTRQLGVPVRTYFGLDSRLATAALAGLTWLPYAERAPRGVHFPGTDRWLIVARARNGTTRWAHGRNQSHATAVIGAMTAVATETLPAGVHHLHQLATLSDVPAGRGVKLGDSLG